jgi:UDP-glucose 4-epimerase
MPGDRRGRYLLRGAGGFLGSHLASRLAPRSELLRLFVRHAERLPVPLHVDPRVEVIEADIMDEGAVEASLESIDTVLEFVGATFPATPHATLRLELDVNLRPLTVLLEAMAARRTPRILFPSSGGAVYGLTPSDPVSETAPLRPESAYGMGKALAEEILRFHARRHRIEPVIVRMSNPYGKTSPATSAQGVIDVFLHRIRQGLPIEVWGDGSQVRDYIFIDDVMDALVLVLDRCSGGEVINIGTGVGHSLNDVIATIETMTGGVSVRKSRSDVYAGIPCSTLNIDKIRSMGWAPRFDLVAGIRETWTRIGGEPSRDPSDRPAPLRRKD